MSRVAFYILAFAALYLFTVVAMYAMQRHLQYFPATRNLPPSARGLAEITVETLVTPDQETLVAWYAAPASSDLPTLLFLHGNAGEIGDRADRLAAYQAAGFGALFLSWRGYGGSTGSPSETGLITDAMAAYDWLVVAGTPPDQIVVVGESLGTGVAVQLAAQSPVGAVVLGAPYSAAVDIAARQYPWLPVRWLMKDQFRSIDHIGSVSAPILVLHGTEDRVIPVASGMRLRDASTAPTTFKALNGKGHEALFEPATWAEEIAFITRVYSL